MRISRDELAQVRQLAYDAGRKLGQDEGYKTKVDELRLQERKANVELAKALAMLTENTARAIVTFIGEGGLRG